MFNKDLIKNLISRLFSMFIIGVVNIVTIYGVEFNIITGLNVTVPENINSDITINANYTNFVNDAEFNDYWDPSNVLFFTNHSDNKVMTIGKFRTTTASPFDYVSKLTIENGSSAGKTVVNLTNNSNSALNKSLTINKNDNQLLEINEAYTECETLAIAGDGDGAIIYSHDSADKDSTVDLSGKTVKFPIVTFKGSSDKSVGIILPNSIQYIGPLNVDGAARSYVIKGIGPDIALNLDIDKNSSIWIDTISHTGEITKTGSSATYSILRRAT